MVDATNAVYLREWLYPEHPIPADNVDPEALIDESATHKLSRGTLVSVGLLVDD